MTFALEEKAYVFLEFVTKDRFGNDFRLTNGRLQVEDEWKNHGLFLEDVLLYIQKHGKIHTLEISADGEELTDKRTFALLDGELAEFPYDYLEDQASHITFNDVVEYLKSEPLANYGGGMTEELKELLEAFVDGEVDDVEEAAQQMNQLIEEGKEEVTLYFDMCKFKRTDKGWMTIPFGTSAACEVKIITYFNTSFLVSNYPINEESSALFMLNGFAYPLRPELMNYLKDRNLHDEKIIKQSNGEMTTTCNQCVNRVKAVMNTCYPCQPSLLK